MAVHQTRRLRLACCGASNFSCSRLSLVRIRGLYKKDTVLFHVSERDDINVVSAKKKIIFNCFSETATALGALWCLQFLLLRPVTGQKS